MAEPQRLGEAMHPVYAELQRTYLTTGLHPWEHDEPESARFIREADVSGGVDALRSEMDQADWDAVEIRDCCGGVEPECYQHYRRYM